MWVEVGEVPCVDLRSALRLIQHYKCFWMSFELMAKLNFVEEPVKILEKEFKKLKRSLGRRAFADVIEHLVAKDFAIRDVWVWGLRRTKFSASAGGPLEIILIVLTTTSLRKTAALSKAAAQRTLCKKVQRPKKLTPTVIVKSPVSIKNCMLGLANVETWDYIVKRSFGVKKPGSCADNERGKESFEVEVDSAVPSFCL
ncbi:hypothetical protein Tco_0450068 [Tanacetum coccineum]